MIKAIIFDVGGVLLAPLNYKYFIRISNLAGADKKAVKVFVNSHLKRFEAGKMTKPQFEERIARRFKIKKSSVKWAVFLYENGRIDREMIKLAKKLGERYVIASITNVDRSRYHYAKLMMDLSMFKFTITSCYQKVTKPDRRIYLKAVKKLRLKPSEILFIDDMQENVKGARRAGLNAIRFKGRQKLEGQLKKFGVET